MSSIQNLTPYQQQPLENAGLKAQNTKLAETAIIVQSMTMQRKIILAEIRH